MLTPRLLLRRPTESDRGDFVGLVLDPATWPAERPEGRGAVGAEREREAHTAFGRILDVWAATGLELTMVNERESGRLLGVAGLRTAGEGDLDLSVLMLPEARRHGYAREAARALVAYAVEWFPQRRLVASAAVDDVGWRRILESSGMTATSEDGFAGPTVERHRVFDDETREAVLDVWFRATEAGDHVGFLPGTPRRRISWALDTLVESMVRGEQVAGVLRTADRVLRGVGFWWVPEPQLSPHVRMGSRMTTDPDWRGRNLGRVLVGGLHRIARDDGAEVVVLHARSGVGLTTFYGECGYVETGRVPGAIRLPDGDEGDDVTMMRRLDNRLISADTRP